MDTVILEQPHCCDWVRLHNVDYDNSSTITIKSSEKWCKCEKSNYAEIKIEGATNLKAGDRQAIITVTYKEQENKLVVIQRGVKPIEGANPHLFSCRYGEYIRFSKGNLQYNASTNMWRFSENQYDVIGKGNENISATYVGWIDLFGFGTSGYNEKHPWMTSKIASDYPSDILGSFHNWGIYNKINGGENKTGVWDVLTADEWYYIISNTNRRALAIINGVEGMILLPDDFEEVPDDIIFWEDGSNIYDISDWLKLEELGAVFLPYTGFREETSYNSEGGFYWTSTSDSRLYQSAEGQMLGMSPSKMNLTKEDIYKGGAVRLITRMY